MGEGGEARAHSGEAVGEAIGVAHGAPPRGVGAEDGRDVLQGCLGRRALSRTRGSSGGRWGAEARHRETIPGGRIAAVLALLLPQPGRPSVIP